MATSISTLALLLVSLSLLAATTTTTARPCKTLFYFSATTTTTHYPYSHSFPASPHNPSLSIFQNRNPRYLTLIFTSTRTQFPDQSSSISSSSSGDVSPLGFYSTVSSSIRDRTKDIMSVVGALLFGVGCGALTAGAMYLVWALFSPRGGYDYDDVASSSDDEDQDDDVAAIKRKLGYVAIQNDNNKVVDGGVDDLKKPKEVV